MMLVNLLSLFLSKQLNLETMKQKNIMVMLRITENKLLMRRKGFVRASEMVSGD